MTTVQKGPIGPFCVERIGENWFILHEITCIIMETINEEERVFHGTVKEI